jgi:ribonuclease E
VPGLLHENPAKRKKMVENKTRLKKAPAGRKTGSEKRTSTGAWWKSAVTQGAGDVPDNTGVLSESVVTSEQETGPVVELKQVPLDQTEKTEATENVSKDVGENESDSSILEPKKRSGRRPPRKRPSRKPDRRPQEDTKTDGIEVENAAVEHQHLIVTEAHLTDTGATGTGLDQQAIGSGLVPPGGEDYDDAQLIIADGAENQTVLPAASDEGLEKRKSGRSRRGRRGSKKSEGSKVQPESIEKTDEFETESMENGSEQKELEGAPKTVRKLLINAEEPEECRLALLEDGRLESIYVSTVTRTHTKNNIYKARIVALEANLQAAFVDFGTDKNGFLPFSEIHPEYYRQDVSEKTQKLIEQHQWKKLSITDVLDKGQEVLVQVVKEEMGTKGANMTTYLSLPGRCVVLLPGSDSSGVSRKISGEDRRSQLRDIMESMAIPEGIGWIVRTASSDINKAALSRDVAYLLRLWTEIKKKGQEMEGLGLVYQDHDSVLRFLREHFDAAIEEILVDDLTALEQVKGFIELLPTKQRTVKVKLHRGSRPIFNQYSVEDQIESIYQSRVSLPSGGSIVIDPTEALVAIDVNSGSTSKGQNFEASIFQANMEAAAELARQLRLRDLGGLIVVDFIDMRSQKNIREVEKQVKTAMKRDKAKVDISRISKFGLMQISRQKLGAPIDAANYQVCDHCNGRGTVRSVETLALFYLRRIQTGASRKMVQQVECHLPLGVARYLLNNKRKELLDLETRYSTEISIIAEPSMKPSDNDIIFHKVEKESSGKNQA